MMKKLLYALLPLALCLMGSGSAQSQTTQTEEINVQRGLGLNYAVTDFSNMVDYTSCYSFLGISQVSEATLVFINKDDSEVTPTWGGGTPDGWCDADGNLVGWNNTTSKICVKFKPNQEYTICDMNGADIDGKTYSVRYGLKANDKTYIFKVNVTFAAEPIPNLAISENIIVGGSVEYAEIDPNYVEKTITLSPETQAEIAAELGVSDLSSVTYYGFNPTTEQLVVSFAGYDGWRSTNGDFANHTGTAAVPICVKLSDGVNFFVYNIQGATPNDYHAYWAFATDTKAVIVDFVVTITEVPIEDIVISNNIISGGSVSYVETDESYLEKMIALSSETQTAIASELGVADLTGVRFYGYNPTTEELVKDYVEYDGWRNAAGDFSGWTGNTAVPICVKIGDGVTLYTYNIQGTTPSEYHAYWAYAKGTNAVVVDFIFNVLEDPALHPVLTNLTVTEGPEIVIEQVPKNDWSNDTFFVNITAALNTLGISAEDLTAQIQDKIFTKDKDNLTKLTTVKTADGSGWWYTPLDLTQKGECASHAMEENSRVFMAGFAFDGTNLTGYVGQNAYNIPAPGDSYFAYVYIVNGTIAYRVKITLNIITPTVDWVETQETMPTAYGVTNVNLTRTFYSGWNTLVLPFDVNMSELNASDKNLGGGIVEAGVFNSDNIDGQDVIHILFEKISETTGTIAANTPFMLYYDDSDEEMTLTFSNVNVNVVDVPTTSGTSFDFVGTYVQGELIGANDYYVGKENSFWKSNRTRTTKGFRAFLKAKSEGAPARIAFEFGNGEATAIQTLDGEDVNAEQGEWYTLAGQRIAAPAQKGLYIKNGKKYFVK